MHFSWWNLFHITLLCCCFVVDEVAASELYAEHASTTRFFLANQAHPRTGKTLVDQDAVVAFVQTQQGRVLFTPAGAAIGMPAADKTKRGGAQSGTVVLQAGFAPGHAAKRALSPRLAAPSPAKAHFLVGERANWRTDQTMYGELVYDHVWDGISVTYLAGADHLRMRVTVEPHADPARIALHSGGDMQLGADGTITASLAGAELHWATPQAYQEVGGRRLARTVFYRILPDGGLGFSIDGFDPSRALTIEPQLSWSTFLGGGGGSGEETAEAVTVDGEGHAYVTGATPTADFPTTAGSYAVDFHGRLDVYVAKLNPDGSALLYSTFIGGRHDDLPWAVKVDASGHAYVGGYTRSDNFPTTPGAYDQTFGGNFSSDAFLVKLDPAGAAMEYGTYLGGDFYEVITDLALNEAGEVTVVGETFSSDFPTTPGAFDETHGGSMDAFVAKFNSAGSGLAFATYLGGAADDGAARLALAPNGNV
ncbi:DUF7948 domain-containing protein [Acanthopleuribacter pedis]|uniref:DUF7948 domain-containing protein n=1 Tax=Acanthopleuribacter pedis TaxID=442870 RepID=A0A8J7QHD6_9BACT|nr:hypothetical protein [Acanthopleuribacter pedis]MBO1322470.1 hypothetical protein [Acanthopleuribacter pedis]